MLCLLLNMLCVWLFILSLTQPSVFMLLGYPPGYYPGPYGAYAPSPGPVGQYAPSPGGQFAPMHPHPGNTLIRLSLLLGNTLILELSV